MKKPGSLRSVDSTGLGELHRMHKAAETLMAQQIRRRRIALGIRLGVCAQSRRWLSLRWVHLGTVLQAVAEVQMAQLAEVQVAQLTGQGPPAAC